MDDFKVVLTFTVKKKDPTDVWWSGNSGTPQPCTLLVCFEVERTIRLPFPPYVGLAIQLPLVDEDFELERVVWDQGAQHFYCTCKDVTAWSEPGRLAECYESMLEDADSWDSDGWTVHRGNLCIGRWVGLHPRPSPKKRT